jgi:hypothetical protein
MPIPNNRPPAANFQPPYYNQGMQNIPNMQQNIHRGYPPPPNGLYSLHPHMQNRGYNPMYGVHNNPPASFYSPPPPPNNHLQMSHYEEQLFNEAFILVNQLKNAHQNES